ncbi:DEAD/DEAH box helicase [Bacillus cereus]|uniref:DEAD/DEAH box helicase n=1 Tax=Bacillus cereus TaxID=1396 RepID=UPI0018F3D531|nr:ATP-binding domain-containing protein [Bacillus cereus]MBJ7965798.1 DEAD/DEAH box helicase [Bacillus cereus]MBJ8002563.1 DEAD/DEAH box helicase [Bacillus cereus]
MIHVINGEKRNAKAISSFEKVIPSLKEKYSGTIYYGFALSEIDNIKIYIDLLIITKEKGILAVNFSNNDTDNDIENIDRISILLETLLRKNARLRDRRKLAIPVHVINYVPTQDLIDQNYPDEYTCEQRFLDYYDSLEQFDEKYYEALNESLDKIVSAKPKKSRKSVIKEDSKGAVIKKIELEVANMDHWQRAAAYEIPDTPQRIRGLAGSGKTVVLALKAAYLHFVDPDAQIAITFYSRSLYQQFKSLIKEFYEQYSDEKVDFDKIHVIHAWGTIRENGLYSNVAEELNSEIYTYNQAKSKFGEKNAFGGACEELLKHMDINSISNIPMYDYILIDEAQDFPATFFRLVYRLFKGSNKRIVYAYDELQNLNKSSMPTLKEMFGTDANGRDLVDISNSEDINKPKTDIILPICYRNSKWALTVAHALGFGVYRNVEQPLVQFFEDLKVWLDIGYEKIGGELEFNSSVKLRRDKDSTPKYFDQLMSHSDSIEVLDSFASKEEEYMWVAQAIKKNIEEEELDPDDILVIFPETMTSYSNYEAFLYYLEMAGIKSIMPGKDVDRDTFTKKNHITCTHIHRAKGNEKPMVYLMDSEYGAKKYDLINVRNTLFTAITRSRAWIRITGTGIGMTEIKEEINKCIRNEYTLEMNIPTREEIKKLNLLNQEPDKVNKNNINSAEKATSDLIKLIQSGAISVDALPQLKDLANLLDSDSND